MHELSGTDDPTGVAEERFIIARQWAGALTIQRKRVAFSFFLLFFLFFLFLLLLPDDIRTKAGRQGEGGVPLAVDARGLINRLVDRHLFLPGDTPAFYLTRHERYCHARSGNILTLIVPVRNRFSRVTGIISREKWVTPRRRCYRDAATTT